MNRTGKRFGFTYLFCNNLRAMKEFYSDVLHLTQTWEDATSIAYHIGYHQLNITLEEKLALPPAEYAMQPGWSGGTAPRTSWSLECDLVYHMGLTFCRFATMLSCNAWP